MPASYTYIYCRVEAVESDSVLCQYEDQTVRIPRSLIDDERSDIDVGNVSPIYVERWYAQEQGWV